MAISLEMVVTWRSCRVAGEDAMQYARLGRTGLRVSRLCLGTMNFSPLTSEADSFAIMDRALELGINFFDTANVYGWKMGEGITEQIIGRWFAQGGGRREKVVLATKVYGKMGDWPNESRLSALHIRRACEASLRRLQTDYIDLYQMHHIDRDTPWEEIWQAMEQLVREGKVLYVGSSNFAGWHIAQANEAAQRRNFMGLVSEQSLYNLSARMIELEVIPACQSYGVGIIPWSPLGGGLLGGVLQKVAEGRRADARMQERIEKHRAQLEAYEGFCREIGERPADVALAWLLQQPAVTAPIIGPRTLDQLNDSLRALEITLSDEALARLDAIWPGPGGPAPEAYAW
jgi:Predicted oxidoreductases (related to aryl-alcohol dehydrogenases)